MFRNFKQKFSGIFSNKHKLKRSESVKVESKNKLVGVSQQEKRQSSQSKKKHNVITITPKRSNILENINQHYDQLSTRQKDKNKAMSKILQKQNWLDFVSDIQKKSISEEDQQLLQNPQESKDLNQWNVSSMLDENSSKKIQQHKKQVPEQSTNKEIKIQPQSNQKSICTHNRSMKISSRIYSNSFCPDHKQCMICGQKIEIIKQSTLLGCAHRVHKQCQIAMKWKNMFKCNICQRKRFRGKRN